MRLTSLHARPLCLAPRHVFDNYAPALLFFQQFSKIVWRWWRSNLFTKPILHRSAWRSSQGDTNVWCNHTHEVSIYAEADCRWSDIPIRLNAVGIMVFLGNFLKPLTSVLHFRMFFNFLELDFRSAIQGVTQGFWQPRSLILLPIYIIEGGILCSSRRIIFSA